MKLIIWYIYSEKPGSFFYGVNIRYGTAIMNAFVTKFKFLAGDEYLN